MKELSTGKHLISSLASATTCPTCMRPIWVATVNGFPTKVEPTPLNLEDELKERLAGRMVYLTHRVGQVFELVVKKVHHILNPDPNTYTLATHLCRRQGFAPIINFYQRPTTTESEGIPF